jgi:hypothetical protein
MAALEHENPFSRARQIGGINQPVMPTPDHYYVVFIVGLPQAR